MKNREIDFNKGSTTVFLCLITGLVLILIFALVAVVRFRWEKTQIVRSARISVEAEFGKFYRPLYDSYKLFYYVEDDARELQAGIAGYFMKNQERMPDILSLTLSYVDVTKKIYAIDNGALNVGMQMAQCALYSGIEQLWENELFEQDAKNMLDDVQQEIRDMNDKVHVDGLVLSLLEIVEGVTVSEGKISVSEHFVKEAIFAEASPSNVGVDSDMVWSELSDKYWNADIMLQKLTKVAKKALKKKKVLFPSKEIKKWRQKLVSVKEKSEKASEIAGNIISLTKNEDENSMICNPGKLKSAIDSNIRILEKLIEFADKSKPTDKEGWMQYDICLKEMCEYVKSYKVSELRFDYSGIVTTKREDPRNKVAKESKGIIDMLINDSGTISAKSISEADVYMKLMKDENEKEENDEADIFGNNFDNLADFISDCTGVFDEADGANKIELTAYSDLYFKSYCKKAVAEIEKHVLEYEREYIISGNTSDLENLKETVHKLLLARTGISLVELLNDKVCKNEAYLTALSIVGFTGVDALVKVVQYSILAAWAYEDACIDVAILLSGKKIPFDKRGNLNISYIQMFEFGKDFIRRKVRESSVVNGTDYDFWLNAMVFMQKKSNTLYRAMDLIQANIKLNFSNNFSFQKAVCGAEVSIGCCEPYESHCEVGFEYE